MRLFLSLQFLFQFCVCLLTGRKLDQNHFLWFLAYFTCNDIAVLSGIGDDLVPFPHKNGLVYGLTRILSLHFWTLTHSLLLLCRLGIDIRNWIANSTLLNC